jgi:hypothetical protein
MTGCRDSAMQEPTFYADIVRTSGFYFAKYRSCRDAGELGQKRIDAGHRRWH